MHFDRLRAIVALPPEGGWRADLAIDRAASPPRAVLVSRVPATVTGDALALARLARGLDLASRAEHPALRRLLGTGELEGDLVLVEAWREGETLRSILDAGGSLDPALVVRIGVEVAGALQACQAIPATGGRPLAHGAVGAEQILLAEDGAVLLCGTGRPFTDEPTLAEDLRALARVLLECLPPSGEDGPGVLVPLLDRALDGEGYASAADFAAALAAAIPPAPPQAIASRAEAAQPEGTPAWLSRRRALAQALRAEQGAAADEVVAPPLATTPPPLRRGNGERQAQPPPPVPSPAIAAAAEAEPAEQFYEPPPVSAAPAPEPPAGLPATPADWIVHRRAAALVIGVAGSIGLLLGLLIGRR
jgi:hypothetical protein